jgi:hypothetical protein
VTPAELADLREIEKFYATSIVTLPSNIADVLV